MCLANQSSTVTESAVNRVWNEDLVVCGGIYGEEKSMIMVSMVIYMTLSYIWQLENAN